MARPLRIEFPGAVYHVTCRGDRREPIFTDDTDRQHLLGILGDACRRFDARALAYCLMGNHYHLVLQTQAANLSRVMRQVNGVYTQRFNRRHGITGHLLQGRFHAVLVDRDAYLLEVCRYVDLNPVRAGFAAHPGEWRWSSYRALVGLAAPPAWLDAPLVWGQLLGEHAVDDDHRPRAAQSYAALVDSAHDHRLWQSPIHRQRIFLGDEAFVGRSLALAKPAAIRDPNIPRTERASPASLDDWLLCCASREEAVARAYLESRWTMTRIARALGVSVQHVSRLIRKWERR